jgi:hypothetical protein
MSMDKFANAINHRTFHVLFNMLQKAALSNTEGFTATILPHSISLKSTLILSN